MNTERILEGLHRARERAVADFGWTSAMSRAPSARAQWLKKAREHHETIAALDAARDVVERTERPLRVIDALTKPFVRVAVRASDAVDRLLSRYAIGEHPENP